MAKLVTLGNDGTKGTIESSTLGGNTNPAGNNKEVQFNNIGDFAGANNVQIDNGDLVLLNNNTLVTPQVNSTKIFAKKTASRTLPSAVESSGLDYTFQPALWQRKISRWNAQGNSTSVIGTDGLVAPATLGSAVIRNVATTNILTRAKRIGYVSNIFNPMVAQYITSAQYTVGNGSIGGFFYSYRFGISDAVVVTDANCFIGLSSQVSGPTNINPNTMTNSIGIGHTLGDTNWFLYYGGSVIQNRINLGASFPISNTNFMDFTLWSPPNEDSVVYYRLEIIGTSNIIDGSLGGSFFGVQLPSSDTLLAHRAWRCSNNFTLSVGLDASSIYFETPW